MTVRRYIVETVNNAWSYIIGPNGYREGPYRYRWEAEEYAESLEQGELVTLGESAPVKPATDT